MSIAKEPKKTALTIECTGCGSEIVSGNAFVNDQGWFHNEVCVRSYWQDIGYVPGAPEPSREPRLRALSFGKVIEWLNAAVTDWDGSRMRDGEPPRPIMTCRDVRELAAFVEQLERQRRDADATIRSLRLALNPAPCGQSGITPAPTP